MRIACEFHWEMGHRIAEHPGLCKNLHGHSYRMLVSVDGDLQPSGMVMDFYDLKSVVDPIVDALDHCFLADERDTVMRAFFTAHPMKVVFVPFPTTAENIAQYVLNQIKTLLARMPNVHAVTVRVEETGSSFAEATAALKHAS